MSGRRTLISGPGVNTGIALNKYSLASGIRNQPQNIRRVPPPSRSCLQKALPFHGIFQRWKRLWWGWGLILLYRYGKMLGRLSILIFLGDRTCVGFIWGLASLRGRFILMMLDSRATSRYFIDRSIDTRKGDRIMELAFTLRFRIWRLKIVIPVVIRLG